MRIYIVWILFFAKFLIRMPRDGLQNLSGLLIKLDDSVTKDQLQTDYQNFARKWESIKDLWRRI